MQATTLLGSHAQLQPPIGGFDDPQAYHLLLKMLQKKPAERIEAALTLKHSYLAGGVDTVEMEASFGPMQKGHLFLRSLLIMPLGIAATLSCLGPLYEPAIARVVRGTAPNPRAVAGAACAFAGVGALCL